MYVFPQSKQKGQIRWCNEYVWPKRARVSSPHLFIVTATLVTVLKMAAKLSEIKDTPQQLIKVAAALRMKYRKGAKVRLAAFLVGFHPSNRGGAKLSGLRVMELMKQLLEKGFDEEEADCGGVVVESASIVMD